MTMKTYTCVLVVGAALLANANAAVIIDFTGQGSTYDGQSSVLIENILDIDSGVSFNMTVTAVGGTLNSNADDFGVDDALINSGEMLEISFTENVIINYLDFGGIGSDSTDGASVTIGANSSQLLHTGVADFNGTSDVWSPTSDNTLNVGQKLFITVSDASAVIDLERVQVSVVASVPEPSSVLLLGMGGLIVLSRRKRAHHIRRLPNE